MKTRAPEESRLDKMLKLCDLGRVGVEDIPWPAQQTRSSTVPQAVEPEKVKSAADRRLQYCHQALVPYSGGDWHYKLKDMPEIQLSKEGGSRMIRRFQRKPAETRKQRAGYISIFNQNRTAQSGEYSTDFPSLTLVGGQAPKI